jgi:protein-S-isoprenylcysteine O-methyltransferase Ste14
MAGPAIPRLPWTVALVILGWISLAAGTWLGIRCALRLAIDTQAMLYVFYPPEGNLLDTGIYSIIRHPFYAAGLSLSTGLALIHANWYALLVSPILWLFVFGWIRLVEERELGDRFPGYYEYRRRVPAFWPRPRHVIRFWHWLITGG